VPLNPGFSSLNLAQAVLLIGYEWFQLGVEAPVRQLVRPAGRVPATSRSSFTSSSTWSATDRLRLHAFRGEAPGHGA
jgi:tRNA C32,U32 (ribose-2'-O)-methylase TrmJ